MSTFCDKAEAFRGRREPKSKALELGNAEKDWFKQQELQT
jgi:hypothetical protein